MDKRILIDYLFRLIEKNDLDGVKELFKKHPELLRDLKKLRAQNGWSPDLFSARFGYTDMLKYFLEDVYQYTKQKKKISDLILLNIHSGSLKTMYYLQKFIAFTHEDLPHYYINSCKLDKSKLGLFFLLRGALVLDNLSSSNSNMIEYRCYNLYCKNRNIEQKEAQFYSMNDVEVKKEQIIYTTAREVQMTMKIISNFLEFNRIMIMELEKRGIKQNSNSKTK